MTNIIYSEKFLPLPFSRLLFFFFIIHKSLNYFFIFTSYCNIFIQYFIFFFYIYTIPSILHFQNYNNFNKFRIAFGRKFHILSNVSKNSKSQ